MPKHKGQKKAGEVAAKAAYKAERERARTNRKRKAFENLLANICPAPVPEHGLGALKPTSDEFDKIMKGGGK